MSILHIECSPEEKALWVRAAQASRAAAGPGLAKWAIEILNDAADEILMKAKTKSHVLLKKRIEEFIKQKVEAGEILASSNVRSIPDGPASTLGYQVEIIREKMPVRIDHIGICANDPLADELIKILREYGRFEYKHTLPDKRGQVSTFFLDPDPSPFRFYRVRADGKREYISKASSDPDYPGLADWTSDKARAEILTGITLSKYKSMVEAMRGYHWAKDYEFGREY